MASTANNSVAIVKSCLLFAQQTTFIVCTTNNSWWKMISVVSLYRHQQCVESDVCIVCTDTNSVENNMFCLYRHQ